LPGYPGAPGEKGDKGAYGKDGISGEKGERVSIFFTILYIKVFKIELHESRFTKA